MVTVMGGIQGGRVMKSVMGGMHGGRVLTSSPWSSSWPCLRLPHSAYAASSSEGLGNLVTMADTFSSPAPEETWHNEDLRDISAYTTYT